VKTITAQQFGANWAAGIAKAGPAYTAGINGVTESPTAKAAQNLDKAGANYMEAISSGRTAAALNAVSLGSWKASCATGASKLASSGAKGTPKMVAAAATLIPAWQQMRAAADAAPDDPVAKFSAALAVIQAVKGKVKSGGY
jgi:hypothetical protein